MSPTLGNLPKTVFESIEYFSGYLNSGDLFVLKPSVYKSNIPEIHSSYTKMKSTSWRQCRPVEETVTSL